MGERSGEDVKSRRREKAVWGREGRGKTKEGRGRREEGGMGEWGRGEMEEEGERRKENP